MQEKEVDQELTDTRRKKVKRDVHRGPTTFQSSTDITNEASQLLSLYHQSELPPTKELVVSISDPLKPNKYFNTKTLQNLLLWFLTDKVHNPLWLNVKNQSKLQHIVLLSIEIQQSIFFDELNNQRIGWISEVFQPQHKAQFRDGTIQTNFFEKVLSTTHHNAIVPNGTAEAKQKVEFNSKGLTTDQIIYARYRQSVLNEDQLRDNLYPHQRLTLYKDYVRATSPAPEGTRACDLILCMDCEMVTTKEGFQLAKISVVNLQYELLYDSLVVPSNEVLNYNTQYSGITKEILDGATKTLKEVQQDLFRIVYSNSILIGHSLENDLNALRMLHDLVVDTAVLYMTEGGRKLSLKFLTETHLKISIQAGHHDSTEDAIHTLALARLHVDVLGRLEKTQQEIDYDVLEELTKAGNSVLLVCPNSQRFSKYKVLCEEIPAEGAGQLQTESIVKHLSSNPQKLTISQFRLGQPSWQEYYHFINASLQAVYEACRPRTLFMLNFQPNKSVPAEGINIKPFCLFTSK